MAFLEWSDEFSIGVEIFDNEHKALMAILNELHLAVSNRRERAELERICFKLMEHAVQHFRHEELYFQDWAYPEREAHSAAHKHLRRQIFSMQDKLLTDPSGDGGEAMSSFLRQWLTQHILSDDRQYGAFLRQKGLR
jgi:hemerythrin-like metal-binding domain